MGEHPALKNLYEQVIAGKFGWERWGLLGVLSDCVLHHVRGGILEIGCGESSILFSTLAEKYGRNCYHVEYSKSGVHNMRHTEGYFGTNSQVYNMKSEQFFSNNELGKEKLALTFIDGDHNYDVVKKDFWRTSEHLAKGGFIFVHDTLPPDKTWTSESKCGTVYRLRLDIEWLKEWEIFTFPFTAFNVGLSMVRLKEDRDWELNDGS